jgi:hypothetical protein
MNKIILEEYRSAVEKLMPLAQGDTGGSGVALFQRKLRICVVGQLCIAFLFGLSSICFGENMDQMTKLDIDNPKCVVRGPDGKKIVFETKERGKILIPKGSTVTGECFPELKKKSESK